MISKYLLTLVHIYAGLVLCITDNYAVLFSFTKCVEMHAICSKIATLFNLGFESDIRVGSTKQIYVCNSLHIHSRC